MCPRCGLRFAVPAATEQNEAPPETATADASAEAVAYAGAGTQDRGIATGPLVSQDAGAHDTGELADVEESRGADEGYEAGETGEPENTATDDEEDAAFITGESVSLSTGDTDTGALAGRSTRAGDDPIFASLPDVEDDVPSGMAGPPVPYVPYEPDVTPDDVDAAGEVDVAGVDEAPPPYDAATYEDAAEDAAEDTANDAAAYDTGTYDPAAYGGAAYHTGTLGQQQIPYEATPEPAPEEAPEAVRDLASNIARDAENEPEIVGSPVAMAIPTTSVTTLKVGDEQRSRNQLLVAGVAALALLVLCVAVILATRNAGVGNVTPTIEALASPSATVQIVAIATLTQDTTSPNPTTDAIPVPSETATSAPVVVATNTVLTLPTEVALPTNTALPIATDTLPPAPTDTSVPLPADTVAPLPTDTVPPLPTDTIAPAPTDTLAPVPTDTVAPAPTRTQVPRPTNTRAPVPTSTAVLARPTATQPATATYNMGEPVTGFNGWAVLPLWTATRSELRGTDPQVIYKPRGVYWLVRVDVRNTLNESRSLGGTMDFVLRDANGNRYTELSNHGQAPGVREIARKEGFSYLDAVLGQGGEAAHLLIYDLPAGMQPTQLVGRIRSGNSVLSSGQVVWRLNP
ncbi:MAG TPA: hypothetical protein VF952_01315 [Chloroflexia bacterium]|jgi:hypothetical protein